MTHLLYCLLRAGHLRWIGAAFAILLPISAAAQDDEPTQDSDDSTPPGLAYTTEIEGDLSDRLRSLIDESAALLTQTDRLPASEAALRRRLRDDLDRIARILRSEGYYRNEIQSVVDDSADPIHIRIEVDPGPRFRLENYEISYQEPVPDSAPRTAEDVGLELGQPARAAALQAAAREIPLWLKENGYPFGRVANTRYLADMDHATVRAEIIVAPGEPAAFGPLSIVGVESVRKDYLYRILGWEEGIPYDERETERVRRELSRTGLFDTVIVDTPEDVESDGELPVTAEVAERPHRTIGAGVSYSTDEDGPGIEVFWEHRNLFSEAERLRLEASATRPRQSLGANFRKPNYLRLEQALLFENELRRESSEAFDELTSSHFLGLERRLSENWTARAGPSLLFTRVTEDDETEVFGLVGLTGGVSYDGSDDPLNPTRGARLDASVTPYISAVGESARFVRAETSGSFYLSPFDSDRLVLAARGRFGTLAGSSHGDIPANLRFYAGGGGSVRGFAFRSVGPLDDDDDPIGGRAVAGIGLEARIKVTDTIGIVPFVDAGQVYETSWPTGEGLRIGAGLGLRYYTSFGPLRLDVATPVNPRKGVDRAYQFYISIGQSF